MAVFVLDDWEAFKEASRRTKSKVYRVIERSDCIEIHLLAGKWGFVRTFKKDEKKELEEFTNTIELEGFVKIKSVESEECFLI